LQTIKLYQQLRGEEGLTTLDLQGSFYLLIGGCLLAAIAEACMWLSEARKDCRKPKIQGRFHY
jgi:hypothetical protein